MTQALVDMIVLLINGLFKVIFDILTPATTGATPLQAIIYTGMSIGILGVGVATIKGLAKG